MGGSWGSEGEDFVNAGEGAFGFSLGAESSDMGFSWRDALAFILDSSVFSFLLVGDSDGATCAWSADLKMIATLVPGSTVSPTLATS